MQVSKALNVEHVNLVNKQHSRHELGNALVYVLVHYLVDLLPQFVCAQTYHVIYDMITYINVCSEADTSQLIYRI